MHLAKRKKPEPSMLQFCHDRKQISVSAKGLTAMGQREFLGCGNCLSGAVAVDTQLCAFVKIYRIVCPKE